MQFKIESNPGKNMTGTIGLRCPVCKQNGSFHGAGDIQDFSWFQKAPLDAQNAMSGFRGGVRICPNIECSAVVFVIIKNMKLFRSFPPETIDFDSSKLPAQIVSVLTEAIQAYTANCYRASALMVRRLLEEVCDDRNITGKDLKDRISKLGSGALLPPELLTAADELRLLGNDAAHIVSKQYNNIGKAEVEVSIELAKEILKAVYQYSSLVAKLQALKHTPGQ